MIEVIVAFAAGVVFAVGLGVAGMTDPHKVRAFLDLGVGWDPSLAFVMGGAILVHLVPARWSLRAEAPPFAPKFWLAGVSAVDSRLIGGSVLFGLGWGLAGYCPGPALVASAALRPNAMLFTAAMLAGFGLHALAFPKGVAAPEEEPPSDDG